MCAIAHPQSSDSAGVRTWLCVSAGVLFIGPAQSGVALYTHKHTRIQHRHARVKCNDERRQLHALDMRACAFVVYESISTTARARNSDPLQIIPHFRVAHMFADKLVVYHKSLFLWPPNVNRIMYSLAVSSTDTQTATCFNKLYTTLALESRDVHTMISYEYIRKLVVGIFMKVTWTTSRISSTLSMVVVNVIWFINLYLYEAQNIYIYIYMRPTYSRKIQLMLSSISIHI